MSATVGRRPAAARSARLNRELELVLRHERLDVRELAAEVGVSEVTVRKDLDDLAARGLLRREHGFAVSDPGDIGVRLAVRHEVKRRIARRAAGLVADGATVLIESGSSCALLAEELFATPRGVTVVTNSAFIAGYVRRSPHAAVVLLGGDYRPDSQLLVGPLVAAAAAEFFVDRVFLGVDGFLPEAGFLSRDVASAEAARAMAARGREVVVLSDSSKFGSVGAVRLLPTASVGRVVTDDALDPALAGHLRAAGVSLDLVPA